MLKIEETAAELRKLAGTVRHNADARDAIAAGFELIATAMEPCYDCGHPDVDHAAAPELATAAGEAMALAAL